MIKSTRQARFHRHRRVRAKISGQPDRPRLSVYRSLKHIRAQLIDDVAGRTLVAAADVEVKTKAKISRLELAQAVGKLLAERALSRGIKKVVFDRGGYAYHGRVRALAEGARSGGLEF